MRPPGGGKAALTRLMHVDEQESEDSEERPAGGQ